MSRADRAGIVIVVLAAVALVFWATRTDGRSLAQDPCHVVTSRVVALESGASLLADPQSRGSRCVYAVEDGTVLLSTTISETDPEDRNRPSGTVTPAQGCGAVVAMTEEGVEVRGQRWTVLLTTPGDPPTGTSRDLIVAVAASIGQSTSDRPSQVEQTTDLPDTC